MSQRPLVIRKGERFGVKRKGQNTVVAHVSVTVHPCAVDQQPSFGVVRPPKDPSSEEPIQLIEGIQLPFSQIEGALRSGKWVSYGKKEDPLCHIADVDTRAQTATLMLPPTIEAIRL